MIRYENPADTPAIRSIHHTAFGRPDEADLVDSLRAEGVIVLSLVAESREQAIGHILFSRMSIDTPTSSIPAVSLAPLAVLPAHQRQGIGEQLIRRGLAILREQGERIVIVLGHPNYYPRFGFSTHNTRNLQSPFPPHALMALELSPRSLDGIGGKVRYPAAFGLS